MNLRICYTLYDKSTGELRGKGSCAPDRFADKDLGEYGVYLGHPPTLTSRIDISDPEVPLFIEKTVMSVLVSKAAVVADGVDVSVLSAIQPGSVVIFFPKEAGGVVLIDETGQTDFAIDAPGAYPITIKHGAYLDTVVTITAEAP